jgi:hypothetical protein
MMLRRSQHEVGVRVHIYEARRNDHAFGVYRALRLECGGCLSQGRDPAVFQGDITLDGKFSGAVDYRSIAYEKITIHYIISRPCFLGDKSGSGEGNSANNILS